MVAAKLSDRSNPYKRGTKKLPSLHLVEKKLFVRNLFDVILQNIESQKEFLKRATIQDGEEANIALQIHKSAS